MKKNLAIILMCSLLLGMFCLPAVTEAASAVHPPRVVDEGNLLDAEEELELTEKLDAISERQQFDVAVVTVDSLEGKYAEDFADDFYDYQGYGMGQDADGVLLLVSMAEREWHITTTGFGIRAISERDIKEISQEFLPYLTDGEYMRAFTIYADLCEEYMADAKTTAGNSGIASFFAVSPVWILGAFLMGFVLALIPMGIMKRKLKSVRRENAAANYVKQGSFRVTESHDRFLYRNVVRRAKPKESHGGGGAHRGSSGRSHGGGGGKF